MTNDKPRSFLTKDDRAYLQNEKDLSEGSEFNTRRRIRERTEQALADFALVSRGLSRNDRQKLFKGGETRGMKPDPDFQENVRDAQAFLFHGLEGITYLMGAGIPTDHPWKTTLFEAVKQVGMKEGYHVTEVPFSVNAEHVNIENARDKLEKGEELEAAEMKVLIDEGYAELEPTNE